VLFVGRIIPEKGVPLLMDALQELNNRGFDLETVIVGDGPLRPGIEATLGERGLTDKVRFIGAVGQDHLHEWYEWADVFCLPSFTEGLPVVLMEALLFRLAVVTTTVAGIPELVRHGETGLLTTPGRLDLLVEALVEVASDPERRRSLGEAGRAEVLANFDAAKNAIALGQLFRDHVS
jgi:glycosyltransferase involved in cell wall biosynthesis